MRTLIIINKYSEHRIEATHSLAQPGLLFPFFHITAVRNRMLRAQIFLHLLPLGRPLSLCFHAHPMNFLLKNFEPFTNLFGADLGFSNSVSFTANGIGIHAQISHSNFAA